MKSRRMKWAGHVARMEESNGLYRVLVGKLMERDHFEHESLDGRIILRCIFRKWNVSSWTGLILIRLGAGGGHL